MKWDKFGLFVFVFLFNFGFVYADCIDNDGDGYGYGCVLGTDCDDEDNSVWKTWYVSPDIDLDGYYKYYSTLPPYICAGDILPIGYSDNPSLWTDCNDFNGTVWQNLTGYPDSDDDQYYSMNSVSVCSGYVLPEGYSYDVGDDCNDNYEFHNPISPNNYCTSYNYYVMYPANQYYAQDFAMYYDNLSNYMHTFYIRFKNLGSWYQDSTNSNDFGHERALGSNLNIWYIKPGILNITTSGGWDNAHVWAPSVVKEGNNYYMLYTGVENYTIPSLHKERIGLATSTNLDVWTRRTGNNCAGSTGDGCVWDCNLSWTSWGKNISGEWYNQCRDPFFFKDDNGYYYMVYSTALYPYTGNMVIGLAKSSDLINWTDLGPINVTKRAKAESSHIIKQNGYYYLFWTSGPSGLSVDSVKYSYTDNLESGIWSTPKNLSMGGGLYATEILKVRNYNILGYVYGADLYFKRLDISDDHYATINRLSSLDCSYVNPFNVHPNALEILLNNLDDNCNGFIDELTCIDNDLDGYGVNCGNIDCDDTNNQIWQILIGYPDIDRDGFYSLVSVNVCSGSSLPTGYVSNKGNDCDDSRREVNPAARELCSTSYDDDCDRYINEYCDRKVKQIAIYESTDFSQ